MPSRSRWRLPGRKEYRVNAIESVEDIRVFDAIARTGSLSSAARELNLSLTTVSKKLRRLEMSVGFRLVQRTTRRLHLTEEGNGFLEHCRAIIEAVDEAESFSGNGTARGTIRVTAAIALSQRQIAPRLARFLDLYPDITIQMIATNSRVDLVEQKIDVAFRQLPMGDSSFVTRTIAPDSQILCASPDYVARAGMPAEPGALRGHRCLTVGDPMPTHWQLRRGNEAVKAAIVAAVGCTDGEVPHRVALAGGGIAMKSAWDVIEDVRAGRLVRVLPEWWGMAQALRVVYPVRVQQPQRVRAFVDFMEAEFRSTLLECEDLALFPAADVMAARRSPNA